MTWRISPPTETLSPLPPVNVSFSVAFGSSASRFWSSVTISTLAPIFTVPASGASRPVSSPSSVAPTEIAVVAGTQPGAVTTLRGHGMPNVRTGVRGNLHAHIDVVVPSRLDHQDIELLQKLKEHRVRDIAEVKSTNAAPAGGGLFSRLRETFSGR